MSDRIISDPFDELPHENHFPYEKTGVPQSDAVRLETLAKSLIAQRGTHRRKTIELILQMGSELAQAHDLLANHHEGTFGRWAEERCGISRKSAYRYMTAYSEWGSCDIVSQLADITALYLLAGQDEARDIALHMMQNGERLTTQVAQKIIADLQPAKPMRMYLEKDGKFHANPKVPEDATPSWRPGSPFDVEKDRPAGAFDPPSDTFEPPKEFGTKDHDDDDDDASPTANALPRWSDVLKNFRGDPTDCWRHLTAYDNFDFCEDLQSLVAYHWRLAKNDLATQQTLATAVQNIASCLQRHLREKR